MSPNFPPFLYALFVPVMALFCLFPLFGVGLVGVGLWRFAHHADGKHAQAEPKRLTLTGFRRPARRANPRATRLAENRIHVKAHPATNRTSKSTSRLAPKPAPRNLADSRNPGRSTINLVYPIPDRNRGKYTSGRFADLIQH